MSAVKRFTDLNIKKNPKTPLEQKQQLKDHWFVLQTKHSYLYKYKSWNKRL